jgi:hypothetical protein
MWDGRLLATRKFCKGAKAIAFLFRLQLRCALAERYSEVFPMFLNPHPELCTDPVFSSSLLLHFRAAVIAQLGDGLNVNAKVKINAWCVQIGFGAETFLYNLKVQKHTISASLPPSGVLWPARTARAYWVVS